MRFQLPFDPPVLAMVDVRHGGPAAVAAMAEIMVATDRANPPLGAAIYAGIDDDKVLTYAQWIDKEAAQAWMASGGPARAATGGGERWSARLYQLSSTANRGPLDLTSEAAVIAHTGLFAMHAPSSLAPFLALAESAAATAVAHTPELLTANFHASLDETRAVNLGFWSDIAGFRRLAANPPFANRYWDGLADNEPGLYRRVWLAG